MTHPSAGDASEQGAGDGAPADPMSAAIADIITFNDVKDPNLWTRPSAPPTVIEIVDHDPAWADHFAEAAHDWAAGESLAFVLGRSQLPAGDFVRWVRQVVDLAGQISQAPGSGILAGNCRQVVAAMRRDIVTFDPEED